MGPLHSSALLLGFPLVFLLILPTHSLTCSSQNFTHNRLYQNCTDLPTLNSFLHWTYDSANSTLAIAFIAPPAKSDGWIAWAINPTGSGMVGAQALVSFKEPNGSTIVKTYNISSYRSIQESKLSFDVLESSAEHSGGFMKIFAKVALPKNTTVKHVWQVGSSVSNGMPMKHEFLPANLNSKGTLELVKAEGNVAVTAPGTGGAAASSTNTSSTGGQSSAETAGASWMRNSNAGFYVILLFLGSFLFGF